MRTVQWLFVVSAALFICGIGFVVVGARSARQQAPVAVERPVMVPVATVKQLMRGIVGPGAKVVFEAVSTTVSVKGVEEKKPQNDEEWAEVGNAAAALAEAGNLMMVEGRAIGRGDWVKMSGALVEAAKRSLKAVEDKNPEAVLIAGEGLNTSCDNCHEKYQRQ